MAAPADPAISARALRFAWPDGAPVIDMPELTVARGERVFLQGPSGSGKSTLLGLICGVLTPDSGELEVLGADLTQMSAARRDGFRAEKLGVIFQLFNLLPYLSVIENVALPCRFSAKRAARAAETGGSVTDEARRLLQRLGLENELIDRPASDLSVGQQQRVAAARALIGAPELIIADEPTSALDAAARDGFIDLLAEQAAASGATLLFVSHDARLADHFDRSLILPDLNRAGVAA
nr:ABC transporter ATP-binding protein [Euryhalocaulis caribicus]